MAEMYKRVRGMKPERFIAKVGPVQAELERRAFEIGIRAEQSLLEHRLEGHAKIDVKHLDNIDWYIELNDEAGDLAALSIEFGRAGYIDPQDGSVYGAMEGLYILTNAAHLKRDKSRRLPRERKRRTRKGGKI